MAPPASYSRRRRRSSLLVWLQFVVMICIIFGQLSCDAARINDQVFKVEPKPAGLSGHFLDYLPKRIPIPYSGPSRKHNDIGLQSWRSSP
ncbi:hypothetical protein L484_020741 [Morus notabilis]|uniref:Uncharacterized protein n=1 Tax=Morus notabilis TaxID=981085 RepID=W9R8H7_9ROSA|nr:hypothetical protein L484_020741 [Morus notabilis]